MHKPARHCPVASVQQVPKCFHGEAAEQKRVNKSGPNQGTAAGWQAGIVQFSMMLVLAKAAVPAA